MTKILLVEDDKSLREIYGVRLLAEGYDIVSAGDGEEALAMAIKDRPALIISDVMMPKISGFDMLDILRSTTETRDIKVIMMTALSSEDQRKRGEQLGADRYLVKSQVGIEDVVHTVHEILGDAPTVSAQPSFASAAQPTQQMAAPRPINVPPARVDNGAQPAPPQAPQPAPQQAPAPASAQTSDLPQPTAPFSTPRPANLASRVIEPITTPDVNQPAVGDLMEQELGGTNAPATTPPTSDPGQVPEPQQAMPSPAYAQPAADAGSPSMPPMPPMPQPPQAPTADMDYEATPVTPSQNQ